MTREQFVKWFSAAKTKHVDLTLEESQAFVKEIKRQFPKCWDQCYWEILDNGKIRLSI